MSARILISTFGTRGDIQPFLALGQGLQAAGYEVGVCTPEGFRSFVEENGLLYVAMNDEVLRLSRAALLEVDTLMGGVRIASQMKGAIRRSMDDEWEGARAFRPNLILYHPKSLSSVHVAEKLGIPCVMSLPLPFYTPTAAFAVPFMPKPALWGWVNRATYQLNTLASLMFSGTVNDFRRRTLGLRALSRFADVLARSDGTPVPILYSYSSHLLPRPEDYPSHVHVTGYWFLDRRAEWQPDPELERFLSEGEQAVYVGFGSMGGSKGAERYGIVREALRLSGRRGVLSSGWGGLAGSDASEDVLMTEDVPHDWLFDRVSAVVHHGGSGTTAAGLRAGKPTVISPFLGDQPFWGRVVHERGAGPAPIPQSRLTAENLAAAITSAVTDPQWREGAGRIGERIRGEDGVARAVGIIGDVLANSH